MCIDVYRRVIMFNRVAETLFGCRAGEAIGVPADRFFSERFLRVLDAHLEGARGRPRAITTGSGDSPVGFRRDGTEFALDTAVSRIDGPGGPLCMLVLRDITEHKRQESERAEMLRREQAARSEAEQAAQQSWLLAEASRMLTLSVDYVTTLAGLARLAAGSSPTGASSTSSAMTASSRASRSPTPTRSRALARVSRRARRGCGSARGPAAGAGQRPRRADRRGHRGRPPAPGARRGAGALVAGLGLHSAMLVPLVSRGHVVGSTDPGVRGTGEAYTADDLAMAQELAGRAATAVDRNRQYRQAQEAHARFAGLIDGLDAIVWEADPITLEMTFVSRRAESLLGYPLRQWQSDGPFWTRLIHPDDRETALAELRTLATTGRECRLEYPMIAADGRLVWISNTVQPVRLADGGVVQLRGLMIDITERKRLAEERDRLLAAEQAARADAEAVAQRSRFLAEASELLSSSLDRGATLDSLVGLAVPAFADWCLVHLAEPVAGRRLHAAGADADGSAWPRRSSGWPQPWSCRPCCRSWSGCGLVSRCWCPRSAPPGWRGCSSCGSSRPSRSWWCRSWPAGARWARCPSSRPAPTGATARPTSRWPATWPIGRPSPSTTRGSTRRPRAPTGPKTSSWPPSRTSCARR